LEYKHTRNADQNEFSCSGSRVVASTEVTPCYFQQPATGPDWNKNRNASKSIFAIQEIGNMSITLNGTVPPSHTPLVIIQANGENGPGGLLKFKFSAPQAGAYSMNFCIGPESNPCGTSSDYVVVVPAGQERLAVVDAGVFKTNVLVVGQGTADALPFSVTIE
jgi:hypothetical protein